MTFKFAEEFAPGIPSKEVRHDLPAIKAPKTWEFGLHRHEAARRGTHFDLRLGDPDTGHAHSWAMKPSWPKPGESSWAIAQPTHTVAYMDFKGTIPPGTYGAGKVLLEDRGRAEVLRSEPGHVSFNLYRGSGPEELVLHQVRGKIWRLTNRTFQRSDVKDLPTDKPKYRAMPIEDVPLDDPGHLLSAKIDDAHNLFLFPAGGKVRAVSYRPTDRPAGVIEHSQKVPGLLNLRTPPQLRDTIVRGGLYAMSGAATPSRVLSGMLNASTWKSRELQREHGELRPVIYDVVRHRGQDMTRAPYEEKLKVLEKIRELIPVFELPRMARTPSEKRELLSAVRSGRLPETKEGVVLWPLKTGEPPIKAKIFEDHDVHLLGTYPGEGKYQGQGVGGFMYALRANGPELGRVGTGLSDAQRKDMHDRPDRYVGLVARVTAQEKFPGGALRAPAFQDWHPDKNDSDRLQAVVH